MVQDRQAVFQIERAASGGSLTAIHKNVILRQIHPLIGQFVKFRLLGQSNPLYTAPNWPRETTECTTFS